MRRRALAALQAEVTETHRDLFKESEWDAQQDEINARRVARLEEIQAARWPRRILVRRRLARELRASVAGYGWIDGDWTDRREQAIGDDWVADQ